MVFLPTSHHHDTTVGNSQLLIRKTSLPKEGIKRKCNTSCRPCSHMTAGRLQHDAFDSYSRQVHQVSAIPNHYVTPPSLTLCSFRGTYLQGEVENNDGTRWTSSWVVLGLAQFGWSTYQLSIGAQMSLAKDQRQLGSCVFPRRPM